MRPNATSLHRSAFLGVSAVIVLVLIGVLWLVLSAERETGTAASSDGEELLLAQESTEDANETEASTFDAASLEVTYDVVFTRDPFESIRPAEPVGSDPSNGETTNGTGSDGSTDGTGSGGNGTDGSNDGAPSKDTPVADDGVCRAGSEAVCDGLVVVLTSVSAETAQIEVNGVAFDVQPGESFAGNFQLLRIVDDCVEILFLDGDEADVFSLCLGGVVAK